MAFVHADGDDVALEVAAVELPYSSLNAIFSFHFDQGDSPALLGISAPDDRNRGDFSGRRKMVVQFSLVGFVG